MALSIDASLKTLRLVGIGFTADNGLWRLKGVSLSSPELVLFAELLSQSRRSETEEDALPMIEAAT